MPREIIDTQSSRPAYLRRRLLTLAIAIAAALVVAIVIWTFVGAPHPPIPTVVQGH